MKQEIDCCECGKYCHVNFHKNGVLFTGTVKRKDPISGKFSRRRLTGKRTTGYYDGSQLRKDL